MNVFYNRDILQKNTFYHRIEEPVIKFWLRFQKTLVPIDVNLSFKISLDQCRLEFSQINQPLFFEIKRKTLYVFFRLPER